MSHPFARRLLKEYRAVSTNSLPGVELLPESDTKKYFFVIEVDNTNYASQKFLLQVTIDDGYPVEPPAVVFLAKPAYVIPLHPHVYLNGHICLNILGKEWTPACGIESTVLSVQSMLSTNCVMERPPDDVQYLEHAPKNPKKTQFVYHDDNV